MWSKVRLRSASRRPDCIACAGVGVRAGRDASGQFHGQLYFRNSPLPSPNGDKDEATWQPQPRRVLVNAQIVGPLQGKAENMPSFSALPLLRPQQTSRYPVRFSCGTKINRGCLILQPKDACEEGNKGGACERTRGSLGEEQS